MNYQDDFGQWVIDGRTVAGPATEGEAIALLAEMDDPNRPIVEKNPRIFEIKKELEELDQKSIRALRAGESERLSDLESQAITLRAELANEPETITH